jgi:hypothetical protein
LHIRWGIIGGALALLLSLAVGIVSGVGLHIALIRALIFAAVFFGLGLGAHRLISTYIPDLLFAGADADNAPSDDFSVPDPGARINITVGDVLGAALPDTHGGVDSPDTVGNITDLVSGAINPAAEARAARAAADASLARAPSAGMDHKPEDGYTEIGAGVESAGLNNAGMGGGVDLGFSSLNSGESVPGGDWGGLPDLDALAGVFSGGSDHEPSSPTEMAVAFESERKTTGNKPQPFEGDYNPKEIAAGIRTVLEKDT